MIRAPVIDLPFGRDTSSTDRTSILDSWNPQQYHRYADERLRPAADLVARIPLEAPAAVYDLGCGSGKAAPLLAARWPTARITGARAAEDRKHNALSMPKLDLACSQLTREMATPVLMRHK